MTRIVGTDAALIGEIEIDLAGGMDRNIDRVANAKE